MEQESNAMMSNEPNSRIHYEFRGNIYFTGEMWYVLPVNMSLFDAAFVAGKGYGGAPVAARLRTTIPDELLAINTVFSVPVSRSSGKAGKPKRQVEKPKPEPDASNPDSSVIAMASPDTAEAQGRSKNEGVSCIPIPFPWKLEVYPNPTGGELHLRCTTSYNDNSVSVEIRDAKGALVRVLQPSKFQDAGEWKVDTDCSDLSAGVYIAVLKGNHTGVTTRFVVAR
ncbi:MAG: T9SS type A sorting domain-containing protein [Bacteroidia bacterium]